MSWTADGKAVVANTLRSTLGTNTFILCGYDTRINSTKDFIINYDSYSDLYDKIRSNSINCNYVGVVCGSYVSVEFDFVETADNIEELYEKICSADKNMLINVLYFIFNDNDEHKLLLVKPIKECALKDFIDFYTRNLPDSEQKIFKFRWAVII